MFKRKISLSLIILNLGLDELKHIYEVVSILLSLVKKLRWCLLFITFILCVKININ